jgi:hypothetical protein
MGNCTRRTSLRRRAGSVGAALVMGGALAVPMIGASVADDPAPAMAVERSANTETFAAHIAIRFQPETVRHGKGGGRVEGEYSPAQSSASHDFQLAA